VAGAFAAFGGAMSWWRMRPRDMDAERLWGLTFDTPQGTPLPMAGFKGKPLLVNFWATWCPPCVEEMPLLDSFFLEHAAKGWQVVGLAVDQPSAVRTFLQRTKVTFPIGMAGLEGTELTRLMGNTSGGLPFTVVVSADGSVVQRRMGRVTEADLKAWSSVA
jgi:thiol-disulfide isomerase/thioredoxin